MIIPIKRKREVHIQVIIIEGKNILVQDLDQNQGQFQEKIILQNIGILNIKMIGRKVIVITTIIIITGSINIVKDIIKIIQVEQKVKKDIGKKGRNQ